jgi:hypothetical protein
LLLYGRDQNRSSRRRRPAMNCSQRSPSLTLQSLPQATQAASAA